MPRMQTLVDPFELAAPSTPFPQIVKAGPVRPSSVTAVADPKNLPAPPPARVSETRPISDALASSDVPARARCWCSEDWP